MSNVSSGRDPGRARPSKGSPLPFIGAGVLIAISIVVPLWVPSYAKAEPTLWGFPFFYWYQLLWVFIVAGLLSLAYRLVVKEERRRRDARRAAQNSTRGDQQ
jgi:membrane protein implicated in regulation of membrane protease activity